MHNTNILLFLSDYKIPASDDNPKGAKKLSYQLEGSDSTYEGIQTNDAPLRYLFERAKNSNCIVKRIICITSYKVATEPKETPQIQIFREFVNTVVQEYSMEEPEEFIVVPYDYKEEPMEQKDYGEQMPVRIYKALSSCFHSVTEGEEVYIDYTGGLRDINFLMTSVIRFLEFKGLKCGEIVYSNFSDKKLLNIHYIYDLYQLINGVNEFVNTGSARELEKVYVPTDENSVASVLVKQLVEFSEALGICDIGKLDDLTSALLKTINRLEDAEEEDINTAMLKTLVPVIREKMHLSRELDYPGMIRWCAENNMIQQAATIYTDKMPKYYFDIDAIPDYVDLTSLSPTPGHGIYDTGFYTELFDRSAEGVEVTEFREELKETGISEYLQENTIDRQTIIDRLERQKRTIEDHSSILYKAFNKLQDFIKRCYDQYGYSDPSMNFSRYKVYSYQPQDNNANEDGYILTRCEIPRLLKQFWHQMISKNCYWLHRFLYNNEEDYLFFATAKKRKTDKTLRKKVLAIKKIMNGTTPLNQECDREKLYQIMAYYLAVKLMRNRMNHAGENVWTVDENATIEFLKTPEIGIPFENNISVYRNILLEGISIL